MTLRPCIVCGQPTDRGRCATHTVGHSIKVSPRRRGYDHAWDRLSKRARRMQPFCIDCGSTKHLQADHSAQAWTRRAAGQTIRLRDIDVVCGDCNIKRGSARGNALTRGVGVTAAASDPRGKSMGRLDAAPLEAPG